VVPFQLNPEIPNIANMSFFRAGASTIKNCPKIDMHEPVKIRYAGRYLPRQAGKAVSDGRKSF
jgi:hypothetical protein